MGSLVGSGPMAIHGVSGRSIHSVAVEGCRTFLRVAENEPLDWNRLLTDWDVTRRSADYGFQINVGERATVLQAITFAADGKNFKEGVMREVAFDKDVWTNDDREFWDKSLQWTNTYFDRALSHWSNPSPEDQRRGFAELTRRLEELNANSQDRLQSLVVGGKEIAKPSPSGSPVRIWR
jgi:hypothetical protein